MAQTTTNSRGMGLLGWMFLVFLVLKLTGYIGWSWWWVTAPLWAPLAAMGAFYVIGILLVAFARPGKKKSVTYYGRATAPRRRSRLRRGGRT